MEHERSRLRGRGPAEEMALLERIEAVATREGDDFYRRLARWPTDMPVTDPAWRQLADERGDRYVEAWTRLLLAWIWPRTSRRRPSLCSTRLRPRRRRAACAPCGRWPAWPKRSWPVRPATSPAPSQLARPSCSVHLESSWSDVGPSRELRGPPGRDEEASAWRRTPPNEGYAVLPACDQWADMAHHRLGLLHHRPSVVADHRISRRRRARRSGSPDARRSTPRRRHRG